MKNPALTIMQLELALNNMHNTMVNEEGKLVLDNSFFEQFDTLMYKLQETRSIAQKMRPKIEVDGVPAFINNNKIGR